MGRILAFLLLALFASTASAQILLFGTGLGGPYVGTTYYVDSSAGNNSNSGLTPALAWLDFTNVNGHTYHAGDRILLKGGQTVTGSLTLSAAVNYSGTPPTAALPLVISSYGTGNATINVTASNVYNINLANISNLSFDNLILTGNGTATQIGIGLYNTTTTTQYSNVTFANIDISGVNGAVDMETSGDTAHGYTNVTFTGLNVHSLNTTTAVQPGIFIAGFFPYQWTSAVYAQQNITISNSTVNGAAADGIDVWNVNGFTVTGNRVTGSGTKTTTGTAAIETQASTNGIISFNEFDHQVLPGGASVDSDGLNVDRGSSNITGEYNWVHDNAGAGFTVFQGTSGSIPMSGIIFRYNISQNNGTAGASVNVPCEIVLGASGQIAITGIDVYNNTFYTAENGSNVNAIVLFAAANVTGTFKNNILYGTANPRSIYAPSLNPSTMVFTNNDYFGTTKINWNGTAYTTVAAWNTATGQETSPLTSDPQLASPGNGTTRASLTDYQLAHGSPMIGVGLSISTPGAQDFFGDSIPNGNGTGYNVGADGANR